jgi:hypothetical protein
MARCPGLADRTAVRSARGGHLIAVPSSPEKDTLLKRYLSLPGAGAAAAALVVSSLLMTAGAAQADPGDPGSLVVNIVDQYGRPTVGVVEAIAKTGGHTFPDTGPVGTASSTQTIELPQDGYGLMVITPWSGFSCFGLTTCGIFPSGTPTVSTPPAVTVTGIGTTFTAHVTVPSITGTGKIGSPLTLTVPPDLANLLTLLSGVPGLGGAQTQQWVRGGTDIPGATATSYTPAFSDGSQPLSVRMAPSFGQTLVLSEFGGGSAALAAPFTTNVITVEKGVKSKTKTKISVPKRLGVGERATAKVKVKAKGSKADPDGTVTLSLGRLKVKKKLKDGSVFINLPNLAKGTYTISVVYSGAEQFVKSKAKATVTVR